MEKGIIESEPSDYKPDGLWKCRACGRTWNGKQLYDDPLADWTTWTCTDLTCGGVCDRL